ncbi:MAG: hypothetical protein AUK47_01290 [Deltaproteobacteria bacterium CG2_30_63_29]|nr:MAG: hypothetical protein AUK47_01290 [Deltaproteobacteria bacterium CG2_30_63_29]PJB43244.1 MAG: hypothetical protein CO108_10280 [Deltaproteobacteria bacterium CG_4_9_14_3_um_filter_63_12]
MATIAYERPNQHPKFAPHAWRRDSLRPGSFAVLVNANARGFQKALRQGVFNDIPEEDLYLSKSLDDANSLVAEIVDRGYSTVFASGGDGSITQLLNELRTATPDPKRQPRVGILRMGTGNAIADFIDVDSAINDARRIGRGTAFERVNLSLIESEGRLCPFAGCGTDAGVLNDYIALKSQVAGTPLEQTMTGVRGYLMAGILKTAPEALSPSKRRRVFAINDGPAAYAVDSRGQVIETFRRGAVLYSGDCIMAGASSIPNYGYKLRMFPSATRFPGFFQVRVANMNPLMAVARLGKLWKGQLERKHGVHDFLVQKVRFEFDADVPFHLAGDAEGYRREVTMQLSDREFEFVRPVDQVADVIAHPSVQSWFNPAPAAA